MTGPETRWRITAVSGNAWRNDDLDIDLVVATTAPVVVNAIENAAERNGIELERQTPGGVAGPSPSEADPLGGVAGQAADDVAETGGESTEPSPGVD